jgi:hypothetical protein
MVIAWKMAGSEPITFRTYGQTVKKGIARHTLKCPCHAPKQAELLKLEIGDRFD